MTETTGGVLSKVNILTGDKQVITSALLAPEGLDIAPDGKVIVAEVGKNRVVSVAPNDGKIEVIAKGLKVAGVAEIGVFTGITIAQQGTIYVSSDIDNAVYKITKE